MLYTRDEQNKEHIFSAQPKSRQGLDRNVSFQTSKSSLSNNREDINSMGTSKTSTTAGPTDDDKSFIDNIVSSVGWFVSRLSPSS